MVSGECYHMSESQAPCEENKDVDSLGSSPHFCNQPPLQELKVLKKLRRCLLSTVRLELTMELKALGFPWDSHAGRKERLGPGCQKGELLSQKVTSQNSHSLSDHLVGENRAMTMAGLHLGTNCLALHSCQDPEDRHGTPLCSFSLVNKSPFSHHCSPVCIIVEQWSSLA